MTRNEVETMYTVVDGRIKSPGKFEGEMMYVPALWDDYLNGFATSDDGVHVKFMVTPDDKRQFPELKRRRWVTLVERDDGFVVEV